MDYFAIGTKDNIVVSNSSMSEINPEEDGCPQKFLEFFEREEEVIQASYFNLGTKLHQYIEKNDDFAVEDVDRPAGQTEILCKVLYQKHKEGNKLGNELLLETVKEHSLYGNIKDSDKIKDKFLKEGKDYLNFLIKNGHKTILSKSEKAKFQGCQNSLNSNTEIYNMLFAQPDKNTKVYKEIAFYVTTKVPVVLPNKKEIIVDIKLKALVDRLDIIRHSDGTFAMFIKDLKTTSKSLFKFNTVVKHRRYHRQLAFYAFVIQTFFYFGGKAEIDGKEVKMPKLDIEKTKFYYDFIVVETNGYYNSAIIPMSGNISDPWLKEGTDEYNSLIRRIAWHIHNNVWNQHKEVYEIGRLNILQKNRPDD